MKEKTAGSCCSLAPAKKSRPEVKRIPLTPPKVESATKTGTVHARGPKTLLPNVCKNKMEILSTQVPEIIYRKRTTATAGDDSISLDDTTARYDMFASTYTMVTIGIAIHIARGRFLEKNPG
jgi:hypothetical protein